MTQRIVVQLPEQTESWIAQEAERLDQSEAVLIETLVEEGARARQFPGIAFRGAAHDRRAWIIGAGSDIWEIVEAYRALGSPEQVRADTGIAEQHLHLALAYYSQYPDEIDQALADNQTTLDEILARYPGLIANE